MWMLLHTAFFCLQTSDHASYQEHEMSGEARQLEKEEARKSAWPVLKPKPSNQLSSRNENIFYCRKFFSNEFTLLHRATKRNVPIFYRSLHTHWRKNFIENFVLAIIEKNVSLILWRAVGVCPWIGLTCVCSFWASFPSQVMEIQGAFMSLDRVSVGKRVWSSELGIPCFLGGTRRQDSRPKKVSRGN